MVNSSLVGSGQTSSGKATNIVFIDSGVENISSLLRGLKPNTEAVLLDPTQDGIDQITNYLSQKQGVVDSVQILSHGSAGSLQLGSTKLSSDNLGKYQSELSQWFKPLEDKKPDLLLYGCDVAAGDVGTQFINQLSQITGADVAASTDLTGSAAKGGNWILEKATGTIEAGQAFTKKVRDAYQGVLATYTVTNTNDSGAGSLRQAIIDANATAGVADTINFNIAGGGPQTIRVGSTTGGLPLPYISDVVTIDGTTQPGYSYSNTPIIVLDGSNVTDAANYDGLRFVNASTANVSTPNGTIFSGIGKDSSGSLVQGLVISNFPGSGIKIGQNDGYTPGLPVNNVTVQNNYIGTDITGTVAKPTSIWADPNNSQALYVQNGNNNILRNNLVSGNFTSGIVFRGGNNDGNIVDGNKVGTDVSGQYALGNQRWGFITFSGTNTNLTLTNNLISANGVQNEANGYPGIDLRNSGTATGNIVGTDISQTYALQNRGTGFQSNNSPITISGNVIQGSRAGATAPTSPANTFLALPVFVPPTLAPGSPLLSAIPQNSTSNNGNLVKDIVGSSIGNYAPVPTPGIAITGVDNSNGNWQYSTDDGADWANINLTFPTTPVGGYNVWQVAGVYTPNNPPSNAQTTPTLFLSADNKNRIRFIPNSGYTGTANSVTYQAWDQRYGGNGQLGNISGINRANVANYITGNLSTNSVTAQINVLSTNTAPTLDPTQVISTSSFNSSVRSIGGILVSSILGTSVTDPDTGAQKGIAITKLDSTNGTWQYNINGVNWVPITGAISDTASLLLDGSAKLRFVANSGYGGLPGAVTIRAWDQTNGNNSGTIGTTINGGGTSISSGVVLFNGVIPPVVTAPSSSIDSALLIPITPSPAPPTPAAVIVGQPPTDNSGSSETAATGGNQTSDPLGSNPGGATGNAIDNTAVGTTPGGGDSDCPCEQIIAQKQPNPVTGTILGTNGDDLLAATPAANTVYGDKGNDTIFGTAGNDNLFGGAGNDTIRGGRGNDFIRGGKGADTLYGGRGSDVIKGGRGNDTIYGGRGADFLSGGAGDDIIYGGRGKDFISGGKGNDRLFGGAGDDNICGCEGDDILRGGKGNDTLDGGKGNDLLIGGYGDDILTGGAGSDRFRIQFGKGTDTITDFTVGEDFLELARGLKLSDLLITQGVGATVIGLQPGTLFPSDKPLALLLGVTASSLTPNSFTAV